MKMKMKNIFSCLIFALSFSSSVFASEEQLLNTEETVQFGLWRVHNTGGGVFFVDKDASHVVTLNPYTDPPEFLTKEKRVDVLNNSGYSNSFALTYTLGEDKAIKNTLKAKVNSQLKDGRYRLGEKIYIVSGDTIIIFLEGAENPQGAVSAATVLNKFSNGMVFNGTGLSTIVEPTIRLNANDIPTPAKVLGDCLATYSPETGRVKIPCLKIKGRTTIYHVEQQQVPNTFTFDVNESDVTPVQ